MYGGNNIRCRKEDKLPREMQRGAFSDIAEYQRLGYSVWNGEDTGSKWSEAIPEHKK